jgi:hypothetical protein
MTPATTKSPCGCGQSASPAKSSCACGCGGSGTCSNGAFSRPNFFSGQLLTEDDLQQFVRYVVEKNRLHNRHLFGWGVVCGLNVTCDSCGGAKLTVQPGYALDCCGNDIVVPCAATLDIVAMYQQFRAGVLGTDCGNPCPDPNSKTPSAASKVQHLCLYIRYCEQDSDPVAPYSTGDNCGAAQCEPTRIQEGYRFELRCRPAQAKMPTADNLLSRIKACLGDTAKAEVVAKDGTSFERIMRGVSAAAGEIRVAKPLTYTDADSATLMSNTTSLQKMIGSAGQFTADQFQEAANTTLSVGSAVARYLAFTQKANLEAEAGPVAQSTPARVPSADAAGEILSADATDAVQKAQALLGDAVPILQSAMKNVDLSTLDQAANQSIFDLTDKYSLSKSTVTPADRTGSEEALYFARGVAFTTDLLNVADRSLTVTKSWLLAGLDCTKPITDCTLREEVEKVNESSFQTVREPIMELPRMYGRYSTLAGALNRYIRECACAAANPPCPPCDDMGVLLACFELEDCKVVRICNMERTFVLSAVALRHWLPISQYGMEFERLCCDSKAIKNEIRGYNRGSVLPTPVVRTLSSFLGPDMISTFAESVTTQPIEALRLTNALQAFSTRLAGPLFQLEQPSASLVDQVNELRMQSEMRHAAAMEEVASLRQQVASLKKTAKSSGGTPIR